MKNKTKLAFELLEQEMEVIYKEDLIQFIGGSGGYTWQQLVNDINNNNFNSIPAGSYMVNSDGSTVTIYGGMLQEVVVTRNSSSGGYSSGGYSSNGYNWGGFINYLNDSYFMNSQFRVGSGYSSGGYSNGGSGYSVSPTYVPVASSYYPKSDLFSASAFAGYTGLYIEKTANMFHYTAQEATALADIANALRATKVLVIAGKSIGVVGSVLTGFEGATDADGLTWGDGVKIGIGLVTTFTPYGWAYGVVDLATGVITGTTLTDAIGNAIDGN